MEFCSTIFNTYDMMILDSVFPLFIFYLGGPIVLCYNYNLFLSFYIKEFQCLGNVELAGEERVCPK